MWRRAGDFCEYRVDAVGGGAGHHAENVHGFSGHREVKGIFTTEDAKVTASREENRRRSNGEDACDGGSRGGVEKIEESFLASLGRTDVGRLALGMTDMSCTGDGFAGGCQRRRLRRRPLQRQAGSELGKKLHLGGIPHCAQH